MKRLKGLEGQPHWAHRSLWDKQLELAEANPSEFCHHNCQFRGIYSIEDINKPPGCPQCGCEYVFCGGTWQI